MPIVNTERVHQLIYVSSSLGLLSEAELADLLTKSRRRNGLLSITGMLLYVGGNFIQALEGPKVAVEKRMRAIARDPRHTDIRMVLQADDVPRDFAEWSMGYYRCEPIELVPLGYVDLGRDTEKIAAMLSRDSLGSRILRSFHRLNR